MNLKALRGELSVLELSRRSGVARGTIAALERGEGNPTVDTLYALADTLGVPLSSLLEAPADSAAVRVVRAGSGLHVDGAALEAELLERIERPGLLGELYAIRFHAGAARSRRRIPSGSRSGCTSSPGGSASARWTRSSSSALATTRSSPVPCRISMRRSTARPPEPC